MFSRRTFLTAITGGLWASGADAKPCKGNGKVITIPRGCVPPPVTGGTIYNAASCSQADVQASINDASDGDTVRVPGGSCTWTHVVTVDKAITLQGAGIGNTIITDGVSKGVFPNVPQVLAWDTPSTGLCRLTGFTFQGGVIADIFNKGMISVLGDSPTARIDHCRFVCTETHAFTTTESVCGVADHNQFEVSNSMFSVATYTQHPTWDVPGSDFGDASWAAVDSFGTALAFFFEDNTFVNDQSLAGFYWANDGWMGGRVVFRYNSFQNCLWANHGTETGQRWRGQRQHEIYENTFLLENFVGISSLIHSRSGAGVVYNNAVTLTTGATLTALASFVNYRTDPFASFVPWGWAGTIAVTSITRSGTTATVTTSTDHGLTASANMSVTIAGAAQSDYNGTFRVLGVTSATIFTYTVSGSPATPATGTITITQPWDQNSDAFGYLCMDQPGAGRSDLLANLDPTPVGPVHNAAAPVYVWGNLKNGSATGADAVSESPDVIVENRDFFNDIPKPGYTAYTYPHPLVA